MFKALFTFVILCLAITAFYHLFKFMVKWVEGRPAIPKEKLNSTSLDEMIRNIQLKIAEVEGTAELDISKKEKEIEALKKSLRDALSIKEKFKQSDGESLK